MIIYEHPTLIALFATVAVASLVGLVVQAAIEEPWILAIGFGAWVLAMILPKPGTNGQLMILGAGALGVLILIAKFVFRNWKKSRVWSPIAGMALAIGGIFLIAG